MQSTEDSDESKTTVVPRGGIVWLEPIIRLQETPVIARYEVWAHPGLRETEIIGAFSLNRKQWSGKDDCDALSWYAAVHRTDFTFRSRMYRSFPPLQKVDGLGDIGPSLLTPGVWHSVEVRLSLLEASYSVDGRVFAKLRTPDAYEPSEGYFGMVSYATQGQFRGFHIVPSKPTKSAASAAANNAN